MASKQLHTKRRAAKALDDSAPTGDAKRVAPSSACACCICRESPPTAGALAPRCECTACARLPAHAPEQGPCAAAVAAGRPIPVRTCDESELPVAERAALRKCTVYGDDDCKFTAVMTCRLCRFRMCSECHAMCAFCMRSACRSCTVMDDPDAKNGKTWAVCDSCEDVVRWACPECAPKYLRVVMDEYSRVLCTECCRQALGLDKDYEDKCV